MGAVHAKKMFQSDYMSRRYIIQYLHTQFELYSVMYKHQKKYQLHKVLEYSSLNCIEDQILLPYSMMDTYPSGSMAIPDGYCMMPIPYVVDCLPSGMKTVTEELP